jgi:tol-pal system protein YbgF
MKKRLLLMTLICGSVYAEPETLPPVIDNSSYYGGTNEARQPANSGNSTHSSTDSASAIYQVLGQLEQLQKEVRQLSGTVEEQAHELAELKKRQATLYEDMDQRLQGLEDTKKTAEAAPAAGVTPPAPPPPLADSVPAPPPVVVPPPVAATVPPAVVDAPPPEAPPPSETVPAPKSATGVVKSAAEKEQYQKAYNTLRDGHYSQAIAALNTFLNDFPNGEYAANAQYWLGEGYKASQSLSASQDAFNKVISAYPNSPKVPDALYKLGILAFEQNNIEKAREYLNHVSTGYPNTPAAQLAAKKLSVLNGGL